MNKAQFDAEAQGILQALPPEPKVVVIGSGSFWGHDTEQICVAIGVQLATIENLVMITGGITGIGEAVGRSFCTARSNSGLNAQTYHILPRGSGEWDYGVTLHGGDTMEDRREILGRLAKMYISIEGGPGTVHEARVAQQELAFLIPVARTGGFSQDIYSRVECPRHKLVQQWQTLNDPDASVEEIGLSVLRIIRVLAKGN